MPPTLSCRPRLFAWQKLLLITFSSLALVVVLLGAQAAQADDPVLVPEAPGSISGMVTDGAGAPQANITVTLYQRVSYFYSDWYVARIVATDANGAYRIGLLSAGIYRVGFTGPSSQFAQNYYNNAATVQEGQDVVIAGNDVSGINGTLLASARITGEISSVSAVAPPSIGGVPLLIYHDARALRNVSGRWVLVKQESFVASNPTRYTFAGLPAGVYRICVAQNYYSSFPPPPYYVPYAECYDNIGSGVDNATDVPLAVGETKPNINFVLGDEADLAQITGTVTAQDGTPLANINVTALLSQTNAFNSTWVYASITKTNAAGAYRLIGLQPGLYSVLFTEAQENYIAEAYADVPVVPEQSDFAGSNAFPLQRFEVRANINATLTRASHLVGATTLRDAGPPLASEVQVYQLQNGGWQIIRNRFNSIPSGAFHIGGLGAGIYKVTAYSNALGAFPYAGYYGGGSLDEATPITLTVNETRTNINIELIPTISGTLFTGEISGIVTTTTGPLKDIQVEIYPINSCCFYNAPAPLVYAFTGADGRYRINGLLDGQYWVRFSDPSGAYATIWNNHQRSPTYPQDSVGIFGGAVVSNVNVGLVRGGGIRGNVRTNDGKPLIDIQVVVYENAGGSYLPLYLGGTTTDAEGNYTLKGLHPGVYQLCFIDQTYKYAQSCYGAPPRFAYPGNGSDLLVEAGKTLTGINEVLGPKISYYLPYIGR